MMVKEKYWKIGKRNFYNELHDIAVAIPFGFLGGIFGAAIGFGSPIGAAYVGLASGVLSFILLSYLVGIYRRLGDVAGAKK